MTVLRNPVDTFVESTKPTRNASKAARLRVASGTQETYLYFGNPVPQGVTVGPSPLRLYTDGTWNGAAPTITIRRIGAKWNAGKVNWNRRVTGVGTSVTGSHASTGDGDLWEFDLQPILQDVANGAAWYGIIVTSNSATGRAFRSAEAKNKRPTLTVTWNEGPAKPTRLIPSGGQVISVTKPVLSMNYTDSQETALAAVQVHIKATNTGYTEATGFSTPAFDSGEVVAEGNTATLDLAATAYAGIGSGATVYWTGRVKNASGEWSAWATPAAMKYVAPGLLTITSPSSIDPVVEDFTPTVVWDATHTQEKHRVIVTHTDDTAGLVVDFDSGELSGTDESVEVVGAARTGKKWQGTPFATRHPVLMEGITYTLEVRSWDVEERVQTGDAMPYLVATQDFSVVPSGSVTPVTLGAVTSSGEPPAVTVNFSRPVAPDAFRFLYDGEPSGEVDPDDVHTLGSNYSFTFEGIRPNSTHTYGIVAVENGVASVVTETTHTVKSFGLWLVGIDDPTLRLFLAGTNSTVLALGEDGETHRTLDGSSIRITQAVRSYSGQVTGVLVDYADTTMQQWVENAHAIHNRPGERFHLTYGGEALQGVVSGLTVAPSGEQTPTKRGITFFFESDVPPRAAEL